MKKITKPIKYTREWVNNETQRLLDELTENPGIVYKGELFLDKKYSRSRYHEWAKKFRHDAEISCTIKKIDELLETRAAVLGIKNKGNPAFVIFHLKNNFGWKDKQDIGHTHGGNLTIKWEQ